MGAAREVRSAGPAATFSLELHRPGLGLRLDLDWARLKGPAAPAREDGYAHLREFRGVGVALGLVHREPAGEFEWHLLGGLGLYRLQRIGDRPSVYGRADGAFGPTIYLPLLLGFRIG